MAKIHGRTSIFFHSWPYSWLLRARDDWRHVRAALLFLALALGFEVAINHAQATDIERAATSGLLRWWVERLAIPFAPAMVATVVFVIGIRMVGPGPETETDSLWPFAKWATATVVMYVGGALLGPVAEGKVHDQVKFQAASYAERIR
jgi:hypothetical protein